MQLSLLSGIIVDTTKEIKTPKGSKALLTGCRVYDNRIPGYKYEARHKTGCVWLLEDEIKTA
jgi:hypothetical protein